MKINKNTRDHSRKLWRSTQNGVNLTQTDGPLFKRPVNIDPKVLAALERAGAERVKLELLSPPRADL